MAAAHGPVEVLDAEVVMAVVLEDEKVPGLNVVRAGEAPLTVMEEHMPFAVEYQLCRPQAGRATGHAQEDMVGLLPFDNRCESLA
jgi:hypothetical protein